MAPRACASFRASQAARKSTRRGARTAPCQAGPRGLHRSQTGLEPIALARSPPPAGGHQVTPARQPVRPLLGKLASGFLQAARQVRTLADASDACGRFYFRKRPKPRSQQSQGIALRADASDACSLIVTIEKGGGVPMQGSARAGHRLRHVCELCAKLAPCVRNRSQQHRQARGRKPDKTGLEQTGANWRRKSR